MATDLSYSEVDPVQLERHALVPSLSGTETFLAAPTRRMYSHVTLEHVFYTGADGHT